MTVPTAAQPTEEQWADLLFAWTVCRHVRSNAIVFAKDGRNVGHRRRPDEPGRLGSDRDRQGREARSATSADEMLAGSAVASDAFYPVPRRAAGGDRRRRDGADPARRLEARRRGHRRLRRGRRGDGLHRPPPLPPLMARRRPGLDVLRVFCAEDGSGGNPLGVFLDGAAVPGGAPPVDRARPRVRGDRLRRRPRARRAADLHPRGRAAARRPSAGRHARGCCASAASRRRSLRPPAGEVTVRFDGELTCVAGAARVGAAVRVRRARLAGGDRRPRPGARRLRARRRVGVDRRARRG